ncbi:MAG: hypothetical protein KatS3mg059_1703 [Thermomicrobiales bacterium]|nr:MAG: hypothetical protein KatS3mg059_1703 [Thermomicrobiales bacterium]
MPDPNLTTAARLAIDAGRRGSHRQQPPAGIGGLTVYKERPMLFGTGAVTGNPGAAELRQGALVELVFAGNRLIRFRLHGIESGPSGRPRLMSGDEQAALLDRFWRLSTVLAAQSPLRVSR